MKSKLFTILTKFVFSFIFIGYLLVLFIKSLNITQVSGLNKDLIENTSIISNFYTNIENTNFFSLILQWFSGNWGNSFANGQPVSDILEPLFPPTILVITYSICISATISLAIVYLLNWHFGHTRHLRVFKGNWPSFIILLFTIIFLLFLLPDIPGTIIFDGFEGKEFIETESFSFSIFFMTLLGLFKILAEMNTYTHYGKEGSSEMTYPTAETNKEDQINATLISPVGKWLLALKPSLTIIPQYIVLLEPALNIPGVGSRLIQALLFFDIPVILAITFPFILAILVMRLIIDLVLIVTKNYQYQYDDRIISVRKTSPSLVMKIFQVLTYFFLLLVGLMGLVYAFTGFAFGTDGILKDPSFVNINNRQLPIFSEGYILGTDYLGRDILSQILVSPTMFFIPIFMAIIIRPLMVLVIDRIPDQGDISISHEIFDMMDAIPKLPVMLLLWSMISFFVDQLFVNIVSSLIFSLIYWGWIGKNYLMADISSNGTIKEKIIFLGHLSIIAAMIEYFIIDFILYGTQYGIANLFLDVISSNPTNHSGVFLTVFLATIGTIMIPYIYIHGKLSETGWN